MHILTNSHEYMYRHIFTFRCSFTYTKLFISHSHEHNHAFTHTLESDFKFTNNSDTFIAFITHTLPHSLSHINHLCHKHLHKNTLTLSKNLTNSLSYIKTLIFTHKHAHKLPYSNIITHYQDYTKDVIICSLLADMPTGFHMLTHEFIEMRKHSHFINTNSHWVTYLWIASHLNCHRKLCSCVYTCSHIHL